MKAESRAPKSLDMSLLEFLEYGDMVLIAKETNTDRHYVSRVCSGKHKNHRILAKAFEVAIERRSKYPMQAIRIAS
jgi:hypothetical protein